MIWIADFMKQLIIAIAHSGLALLTGVGVSAAGHRPGQGAVPAPGGWQPDSGQRQDRRLRADRPAVHQARVFPRPPLGRRQDGYDGLASGGSNLGPTNQKLVDRVQRRREEVPRREPDFTGPVPADLVTASGSGSTRTSAPPRPKRRWPAWPPRAAMSADAVRELVARHTEGRQFGILGEPRVNVLKLNLALDQAAPVKK